MNWVDIVILVIIALSAVISLFRGFFREAISLATWVVAFWVAIQFSGKLDPMLGGLINSPTARMTVAFASLFLITLTGQYMPGMLVLRNDGFKLRFYSQLLIFKNLTIS